MGSIYAYIHISEYYFQRYFGSVTFVQDNNCPRNKCTSPCRIRNSDADFLPDLCFRRMFARTLPISWQFLRFLPCICVHPRIARAATSAAKRRRRRTQRHVAADISTSNFATSTGASLFSSLAGHARDAIRIHRRVISPRDILMLALVDGEHCETVRRDVTELHYCGKESAFLPTISGCWVF